MELRELNILVSKIGDAKANRNLVAHGVWAQDDNNVFHLIKYSHNHADKPIKTRMEIEDLSSIYNEVSSSLSDLGAWLDKRAFSMSK